MARSLRSVRTRPIYIYFSLLTLLVYVISPEYFLDIPSAFMLKNRLHATAPEVSMFRLLTGIPLYFAFLFGFVRDLWNPFGLRDRGYFFLFAPVTAAIFVWAAFAPLTYNSLFIGVFAAMAAFRFVQAGYQGLIALIGQEMLMSGRLGTLSQTFLTIAAVVASVVSGLASESLSPSSVFLVMAALMLCMAAFGFWKPQAVFGHAYEKPQARGSDFVGDVKRLLHHRGVIPAFLMTLLWNFNPAIYTPVQFYLTNRLHLPDDAYSNFLGIFFISFVPTFALYGYLCRKYPPSKLLWWSTLIGVPQMIPLLFVHTAAGTLLIAVPMGLLGGMATAAYFDLAVRSCPPGMQGTLMMLVSAGFWFAMRAGDLFGARVYTSSEENGFLYCVIATVGVYLLLLAVIPFIPKELIATTDGEPNPLADAEMLAELGDEDCPSWYVPLKR